MSVSVDCARTLASCSAQVFGRPLAARLKLLCAALDSVVVPFEEFTDLEMSPECILLTESLDFAQLVPLEKAPLQTTPDAVLTMRHRFSPPGALRGQGEQMGASHRAALLALYLIWEGAEVPYAHCHTIEQLASAPGYCLPALPHWRQAVGECAVVDACLDREGRGERPSFLELQQAVHGLLWAAEGRDKDPELVDYFLPFGATHLERQRRIKLLFLESLVPRNVSRVGGLRRLNRAMQDCAVTTMLSLKQLGLIRDVAFLIVQWMIRLDEHPVRCVDVSSDVDLSREQRLDCAAELAVQSLWCDNAIVSSSADFAALAMTMQRGHCVGPEWVFDLVRTLQIPCCGRLNLGLCREEGEMRMSVSFVNDYMWEFADAPEQFVVRTRHGGKCALVGKRSYATPWSYSTLFRAVMYRWFVYYYVLNAQMDMLFPFNEGPEMTVENVRVRETAFHFYDEIKFVIYGGFTRRCFVVQEGSHLFLLPSIERDGQPFVFKTLRELVKYYQRELVWLNEGKEEQELPWLQNEREEDRERLWRAGESRRVPAECAWLHLMFDPEVAM